MTNDIASMTGQKSADRIEAYKLNEVKLHGDNGNFIKRNVLSEKIDGKYPSEDLGASLKGVILKMRWRLDKYEEPPKSSYCTSEYDFKNTDTVVEFSTKDKGIAADIKAKYGLKTKRVLYFYLPEQKEIVRILVNSSALSGELNPNGELGLFTYVDDFNNEGLYLNEFVTEITPVFRKDPTGNKRKDYYAMTFKRGRALSDSEKEKTLEMVKEVYQKTSAKGSSFAESYNPEPEANAAPTDIDGEEIPF